MTYMHACDVGSLRTGMSDALYTTCVSRSVYGVHAITYVHMHACDIGILVIRTKGKAPDGAEIWVSDPKN